MTINITKKVVALMLAGMVSFGAISQTNDSVPAINAENFRAMAESGDAQAQFKLGTCLYHGIGIEQNIPEALAWFDRASRQNYAPAQNAIGKAYAEGDFGKEDIKTAKKYYQLAINQGFAEAMYNMGRTCVDGYFNFTAEAVKLFAQAAGKGYAPAMFDLGHCFEHGYGVKPNRTTALNWYIKASEAGYDEAKDAVTRLGEDFENDSH